ncbi:hypothetical protein [Xanthomonas arboricola]|uniref:hypothetical protein n=1 Tax=Xanthomonas arboricola TaxID=56448 RepID=UPI0011AFE5C6|nr:hypothetical protein [Xanthomonas arboricola]
MNSKDYSERLAQLKEVNAVNMIALGTWVQNEALPWLWDELGGIILTPKAKHPKAQAPSVPLKLKPMKDAEAVRQGLIVSVADRKKMSDAPFYQAQLTMLDAEAKRYCSSIANFDQFSKTEVPFAANASIHTLHRALMDMMELAVVLLEDAAREVAGVHGFFAAWRRRRETPFEVFKGTEQIIYGVYSGMTHADRAPYTPVAVLRTAIELRLRHAFCVNSLVDPSKPEEMIPIDLSKLFEAIQTRQSEIEFAVDVHDVWKIYRWSNFYLHGGVRDFPWVSGFLLQYLRPLFVGRPPTPNGGWSINSGIQMKRETWQAVRSALEPKVKEISLTVRISNAWRALTPIRNRQLQLPIVDESEAQCKFLN